jgi:hypothetical protein
MTIDLTRDEILAARAGFGLWRSAKCMKCRRHPSARRNTDRPMNKPEMTESGLPISGLLRQPIVSRILRRLPG